MLIELSFEEIEIILIALDNFVQEEIMESDEERTLIKNIIAKLEEE